VEVPQRDPDGFGQAAFHYLREFARETADPLILDAYRPATLGGGLTHNAIIRHSVAHAGRCGTLRPQSRARSGCDPRGSACGLSRMDRRRPPAHPIGTFVRLCAIILEIALSGAPNGLAALPAVIIASLNAMRWASTLLRIGMERDREAEDISILLPHSTANSSKSRLSTVCARSPEHGHAADRLRHPADVLAPTCTGDRCGTWRRAVDARPALGPGSGQAFVCSSRIGLRPEDDAAVQGRARRGFDRGAAVIFGAFFFSPLHLRVIRRATGTSEQEDSARNRFFRPRLG